MAEPLYKGDGRTGGYKMYVHNREGEKCERCGMPIVKVEISSRKAYIASVMFIAINVAKIIFYLDVSRDKIPFVYYCFCNDFFELD